MYAQSDYLYDVFISYPWSHPEGRWATKVFKPTLQGELRNAFPHWEPRIFFDRIEVEVSDPVEQEIRDALLRSCVLVPVLCYPYFRSPWCAAEWRTFRTPTGAAHGRGRWVAPVVYAGDPNQYPPRARGGDGLKYESFADHSVLTQATQKFARQVKTLAAKLASIMQNENRPPDPAWPVFTGDMMENLSMADPRGEASQWMLVAPPVIKKPTFLGTAA